MIGFGLGSGATSGAGRGRRRAEQRSEQAALLRVAAGEPAAGRSPSHRPDSRAPELRSPAMPDCPVGQRHCLLQEPLRRRSALARQRPPLALPEALNLSVAACRGRLRRCGLRPEARSRRCPVSAPAHRRPLREGSSVPSLGIDQIVGDVADRATCRRGSQLSSRAASDGLVKSKVGSAVAEHDATNAETIATETMRHSAVALRDRCLGNPVPLPVSEPARRYGMLRSSRDLSSKRPCSRIGEPDLANPQASTQPLPAMDEMRRHHVAAATISPSFCRRRQHRTVRDSGSRAAAAQALRPGP